MPTRLGFPWTGLAFAQAGAIPAEGRRLVCLRPLPSVPWPLYVPRTNLALAWAFDRLLRWSFWRSFHQALLQPTRPHWAESRPNLSCLEPTGTVRVEYGQVIS